MTFSINIISIKLVNITQKVICTNITAYFIRVNLLVIIIFMYYYRTLLLGS